jgi:lysozyme family protein
MPITLKEALKFTLKWEGGFTNDPVDPGGATNRGIIQSVYNRYRRRKGLDIRTVRNLTEEEMLEIYEKDYWDLVRAKYLKSPLGLVMFDTCVNMGPSGSISRLQMALGLNVTGSWTKEISDVIHSCDAGAIALQICRLRVAKRYARIKEDERQKRFLKGWLNRDNDLAKEVKKMIGANIMEIEEDDEDISPDLIDNSLDADTIKMLESFDIK